MRNVHEAGPAFGDINIVLDTSTAAPDTIDYVATDQSGLTSTSAQDHLTTSLKLSSLRAALVVEPAFSGRVWHWGAIQGRAMPKYFFDIIDGVSHCDVRGMEFPNDWSAKNHAHDYAQAMVKRSLHGPNLSEWEVVVRDTEHEVTRVKFSDADE